MQTFHAITKNGQIEFSDPTALTQYLILNPGELYVNIGRDRRKKTRTLEQNNAIHLYCEMVAEELNRHGLDMQIALSLGVSIPWTMETVKSIIWKPIQKAQLGKDSTTKLETPEVSKVYETINRFLGERGIHVPFPSKEWTENAVANVDR